MSNQPRLVAKCMLNKLYLELYLGSSLDIPADALVNAANERLEHGGGIAQEIASRAGHILQSESREWISKNGTIMKGGVALTSGGNLPFKLVIHAVGPQRDENYDNKDMLINTLVISLKEAVINACTSINIPGLSCGIYGFPKDVSAVCHYQAFIIFASQCTSDTCLKLVRLVLFTAEECEIFSKEFMNQSDNFHWSEYYGMPQEIGLCIYNSSCKTCFQTYDLQLFSITQNCCRGVCDFCLLERSATFCYSCNTNLSHLFNPSMMRGCRRCLKIYSTNLRCNC